jgi:hypothetical protein
MSLSRIAHLLRPTCTNVPVIRHNRERELGRLITRFTAEAAALGFTIPEVIKHLHRSSK